MVDYTHIFVEECGEGKKFWEGFGNVVKKFFTGDIVKLVSQVKKLRLIFTISAFVEGCRWIVCWRDALFLKQNCCHLGFRHCSYMMVGMCWQFVICCVMYGPHDWKSGILWQLIGIPRGQRQDVLGGGVHWRNGHCRHGMKTRRCWAWPGMKSGSKCRCQCWHRWRGWWGGGWKHV